jgi:DNA mismatch repair protein MutS
VARLSGIPQTVIDRAKEILANLELTEFDKDGQPMISRGKNAGKKEKSSQPNLFSLPQDPDLLAIEKELKKLELETLSPLEALNLVWKWRKKFKAD